MALAFCEFKFSIFSGSIVHSASRQYLIYSEANFEVFLPHGGDTLHPPFLSLPSSLLPSTAPPFVFPYLLPYLTLLPSFPISLVLTALGVLRIAAGFAAAWRCLWFLVSSYHIYASCFPPFCGAKCLLLSHHFLSKIVIIRTFS